MQKFLKTLYIKLYIDWLRLQNSEKIVGFYYFHTDFHTFITENSCEGISYRTKKEGCKLEKKPFNDVDEHYQKHVGTPSSYNLKQMPKPIRYIGYFMIGCMVIAALLIIGGFVMDKVFS